MTLSYRISLLQTRCDEQFARLLEFLKAHRPVVEEVSLFTGFTHHLYVPLDEFAARCEMLGRRLDQLRAAGFASAGINMLCTLGHVDEAWDFWPPLPFDRMVGHDGTPAHSSACPTSPELLEYNRRTYRLVAQARPDFIWVDDDVRIHHHTIPWPCFCQRCIRLFAGKFPGAPKTRKELVKRWTPPAAAGSAPRGSKTTRT